MMYRRIAERVERIAPFLELRSRSVPDDHGRPAGLDAGRLHDVASAIRTRRTVDGVNYIRNSIKVTIDAYHGTTTFHVVDPSDPIAQTVGKIFPGLLKPLDAMPEGLRTRLRYPQQIFAMQAAMFATFHMTNPGGLLQPRGPVGDPVVRRRPAQPTPMHPVLHDHEAAGGERARIHPDAAVHAARQGQPRRAGWWRAATAPTTASSRSSSSRNRR